MSGLPVRLESVEQPCVFVDTPVAKTLTDARSYAEQGVSSLLSSFVIPPEAWTAIENKANGEDVGALLFASALGNPVMRSEVTYEFDGRQPCDAHVDEVPEDLLDVRLLGMFNVHLVCSGAITSYTVHTRSGYYLQDKTSRVPQTRFNPGITADLLRGTTINTYTTDTRINQARLTAGDRLIFFERTSRSVDGPPNVVHLFHRGTLDRHSEVTRYFSPAPSADAIQ